MKSISGFVLLLKLISIFCKTKQYVVRKLVEKPSEVPTKFFFWKNMDLYVYLAEEDGDMPDIVPFPFLVQKLRAIPEIVVGKGGRIYHIKPFEYADVVVEGVQKSLGVFYEATSIGNNIVVTYRNISDSSKEPSIYKKSTIIFSPSKDIDKVERLYNSSPELCMLKVFISDLNIRQKRGSLLIYMDRQKCTDGSNRCRLEKVEDHCGGMIPQENNDICRRCYDCEEFEYSEEKKSLENYLSVEDEMEIFNNPENTTV